MPFEQLTDEAFEAFIRDLYRGLHPELEVTRNGSTGYKQFGVDVFATGQGTRLGIQCKHEKRFGPADVKKVVKEVRSEAEITSGLLALSRPTASPGARLEIQKHPGWKLWDGEDLTTRVRDLPNETQLRLIDAYFPRMREQFLGIPASSPWLLVTEYEPALAGRLGYDRQFGLVGRDSELQRLSQLIADHERIVLVVGRGGIGKTRLLTELARTESARQVRFASKGPISAETFDLLPEGAPVILLDDALSLDSSAESLVAGICAARPDATVVLSIRPQLEPELLNRLSIAHASASKIKVEVTDLPISEAEELAREALGKLASPWTVEQLGRAGYDCPLLIVIGAHLIKDGHLLAESLLGKGDLREEILTHFADVLTRGSNGEQQRAVLDAIASVQPARLDDSESLGSLTALSDQPEHAVLRTIDELEDLGIVMRRAQSVRVVPDLLGEAILERALVTRSGIDTRWSARISQLVRGGALANAIRNVSLIDWHRRQNSDSRLGSALWASLTESVLEMSNSERKSVISGVEAVAAVHAGDALDLAQQIINNPAPDEENVIARLWGGDPYVTAESTNQTLTGLIRNATYDPDYLERGMELLYAIGRNDSRAEHQNPGHAMRLLREIGKYSPRRPVSFNTRFLETVGHWLADNKRTADHPALISLLKGVLATEVTITESRRGSITMTRHNISMETVQPLRRQAIEIAGQHLRSEPRTALAAIDILSEALRTAGRNAATTSETELVLDFIGDVLADPSASPSVRLSAVRALNWQANYGTGECGMQARVVRRRLVIDTDYMFTRLLRPGWAIDDDYEENTAEEQTDQAMSRYERSMNSSDRMTSEIANEWSLTLTDQEILERMHRLMRDEQLATGKFLSPDQFLVRLFEDRPGIARTALARPSVGDDASMTTQRVAMMTLFALKDPIADVAASTLMGMSVDGAHLVASAIASQRGATIMDGQRMVVRQLAALNDETITTKLLGAARWWQPEDHDLVLELVMGASVGRDTGLAEVVADLLTDGRVLSWLELPESDRQTLLARFALTPSLDSYGFARLLNMQIKDDPASALRLLQNRIDNAAEKDHNTYEALPYSWSDPLEFRSTVYFPKALAEIVEWIIDGDDGQRETWGTQLFEQVARHFDAEVLTILLDLIRTREDRRIQLVENLLQNAPRRFVLENAAFVEDAIRIAQDLAPLSKQRVINGLIASFLYGSYSRTVGADDPDDIALRDGATELAKNHPEGSLVRCFYEDVARRASNRIAEERLSDQSHWETRQWQ
ncbi:restriction endonuclease [Glutamicibacter protophormiae]|uniref:restriction endonuclease n=1 Tax=Glutamicibacter protophormiae TaxID=37930 RepID=UPI001EF3ED62|nr:restriction endonuclease [Glutamicibacter protophormiae]